MPYIGPDERRELESIVVPLRDKFIGASSISYITYNMMMGYLNSMGRSYHSYAALIGMLEGLKQELYRREIALYEDNKIEKNGDIL